MTPCRNVEDENEDENEDERRVAIHPICDNDHQVVLYLSGLSTRLNKWKGAL